MWFKFDPANYSVGSTIYVSNKRGWSSYDVAEYTVTRVTPGGQLVAERRLRDDYTDTIRVNKHGNIAGERDHYRRSIVSAEDATELRADARREDAWRKIQVCGEGIEKVARSKDREALTAAIADLDRARKELSDSDRSGEASETGTGSTEGESAGRQASPD